mmetsp:Transcript_20384/g.22642  ORF Transcript_20384/g.22642 Transcript_20384/m.22642 type:complete len:88 (-) Transcript_20384:34-297(-)
MKLIILFAVALCLLYIAEAQSACPVCSRKYRRDNGDLLCKEHIFDCPDKNYPGVNKVSGSKKCRSCLDRGCIGLKIRIQDTSYIDCV